MENPSFKEIAKNIMSNVAKMTTNVATASSLSLAESIEKHKQMKEEKLAKALAAQEEYNQKQQEQIDAESCRIVRKFMAFALNEVPATLKLYDYIHEHSLHVKCTGESEFKVKIPTTSGEVAPLRYRQFSDSLVETIENMHLDKLRELTDFVQADVFEFQQFVMETMAKYTQETYPQYGAPLVQNKQVALQQRFNRYYSEIVPYLYVMREAVTTSTDSEITIMFRVVYEDYGFNPQTYILRINQRI